MNIHRFRSGIIITCFFLMVPKHSSAQLSYIDRQILVMARPGVVSLGEGQTSGWLGEITIEAGVREALLAAGVDRIFRAMPQFSSADTLRILPDGRIYKQSDLTNLFVVEVPVGIVPRDLIEVLNRLPSIEYSELRRVRINTRLTVDDKYFDKQWNMSNDGHLPGSIAGADVKAVPAWDRTTGNANIKIAIVDLGIRRTHDDFDGRVIGDEEYDGHHGTMVAGIAAAIGNNEICVAGMDWESTVISETLINATIIDTVVVAIQSAVNRGARIINMSWGIPDYSSLLYNTLLNAYSADVMLVSSAPYVNHDERWPNYFGSFIHTVSASDFRDDPADYMLPCPFTDVAAPGGEGYGEGRIYTTGSSHDTSTVWGSGTSLAAPHSTGLASLMLALNPNLHNYDIEWLQKLTADGKGDHDFEVWGYGRLNADKALEKLMDPYVLTQGYAEGDELDERLINFLSSPNGYLGEDHEDYLEPGWYSVDPFEVMVDIGFEESYIDEPEAWLSHIGYSDETYNDPESYNYEYVHEDEVSITHLTLRTYFYFILGHGVYVPYNPRDGMPFGHTRVGELPEPPQPPTAPTGLWGTYVPRTESVELEWNRNPEYQEVDYYWLDRADEDGEFYVLVKKIWDPGSGDTVEWTDREPEPGVDFHRYRVKAHNAQGWGPFCYPITVWIGERPPERLGAESAPEELTLEPNYPNPFNPDTQIRFGLPSSAHVCLQIMNIRGQIVRVLVNEEKPAGWYNVTWDGRNGSGRDVASGIYLYIIESGGKRILRKMTLIR